MEHYHRYAIHITEEAVKIVLEKNSYRGLCCGNLQGMDGQMEK